MLKLVLGTLTAAAFVCWLPKPAGAQIAPLPVIRLCPEATWTTGYHIWELIPLDSTRYKQARVYGNDVHARLGVGFEAPVDPINPYLQRDTQVTVIGEAWDMGCNQWMQIRYNNQDYWVHGDFLQLI